MKHEAQKSLAMANMECERAAQRIQAALKANGYPLTVTETVEATHDVDGNPILASDGSMLPYPILVERTRLRSGVTLED